MLCAGKQSCAHSWQGRLGGYQQRCMTAGNLKKNRIDSKTPPANTNPPTGSHHRSQITRAVWLCRWLLQCENSCNRTQAPSMGVRAL